MLLYDVLLFLHIAAAMIWIGAGFLLHVLAFRAERTGDTLALMKTLNDMGSLGNVLFVPASLATFVLGLAMVFVGGWSFSDLWVVLGLAGYLATFCIGFFILKPRGEAIGALVQRDGISAEAIAMGRQLAVIGRIDAVLLFLVVAVMAFKPTIDDVAVLGGMAAVLVIGLATTALSVRAIGARTADA